ncbi:MAG: DNA recombination protein RmuC [Thermoleophilia bacterium]|nr:DNA recombination protein RmuC [Thermoleophilia bacterium]
MDAFKALSAEALKSNNESFLELARTHLEKFQVEAKKDLESRQKEITEAVNPVRDSLAQVDHKLQAMEKERVSSYAGLNEQVKNLALTQNRLRDETSRLVRALRTPNVRGRWGEIQLKRVVEIAGMLPYCDFDEQISVTADDARLRPDLIVRLPGGKNIVVDAKAPLEAYLNALDCEEDSEKNAHLLSHSRQIRDHMVKLSSKAYWDQFQPTPDFVIMFLPGETFFSAALEQNPHIIEEGVNQRVILASPTTLIALLRAVAYGWQQEKLTESAEEISNLGKELFNRLCVFTEHLEKLGNSLEGAVSNYNKAVGSFDSRVLVTARQFPDLGLSSNKEVPYLKQVEKAPREISAADTAD